MASGGDLGYTPWFVRNSAREIYHPGGLINSSTAGRTDRLPLSVATNSYVMPADVVSGLGQGNTLAGANVLSHALSVGPFGTQLPRAGGRSTMPRPPAPMRFATGGQTSRTSILAAGGEYVVPPEVVLRIGNGNMRRGHRILDEMVKRVRSHTAKRLTKLPGPKR